MHLLRRRLLDNFPLGRVDLKPEISSHEHACIKGETLVVVKQTNLSLHRSTSSRVGANILEAAEDLEVGEGSHWATARATVENLPKVVRMFTLGRRSGHSREHLLAIEDAVVELLDRK